MSASISAGVSLVSSDGYGYLNVGVDLHLGNLLDVGLHISTFPGGSAIVPTVSSPLVPSSSVGGGLLDQLLPPILSPVVSNLLGALPTGGAGSPQDPPAGGTTILSLGDVTLNLPGAFKGN